MFAQRIGCRYNAPADYNNINGTFSSCESDNQLYPGVYIEDGQTRTYSQPPESLGAITTLPYEPMIPSSSMCTTYESASLYSAISNVVSLFLILLEFLRLTRLPRCTTQTSAAETTALDATTTGALTTTAETLPTTASSAVSGATQAVGGAAAAPTRSNTSGATALVVSSGMTLAAALIAGAFVL